MNIQKDINICFEKLKELQESDELIDALNQLQIQNKIFYQLVRRKNEEKISNNKK
ncbi:hypothetical protein TTHERM_000121037 (macronuclear) [Tetrahymena thermophila SB210]|uniref:Uncharacterized protein n=1 Tax=Tetrahymena thermophila (strain SB210) TaxID=312017 RepID=W7XDX8_TETTS|nr:hypothetical protein TTHERM_000121037 [Tetrahymena thermophila SB210]EWS75797.1 hypothetical protein TTHERM_000121037 [Tetrahymena thermophila SB210]|eukprot:XP_012651719.1 hypothetical protein TTHERM_000121037 [Tetrahymena thermophila SB210]